ncbi:hypothetical protein [Roseisolibacter sp. H3M3-2]|uniref:hypothetical protein n=1 Tax=Roseisolibacter sp. H3M3-2 TaxID=3031323 RepID=UPI0023DACFAD|nr:hypothetical protein [Roseisolibacter sp. H3M3-2]MDF1505267.1 hypothetical protein [Roseisolibacter sp. H3M3-2]
MPLLRPRRARAAAAAALALVAAACSDDDPVSPGPRPGAERSAAEFRRLLVADDAQPFARLYDLGSGQRVDSIGGLPGPVTYLYSAQGRVAAMHFQTRNRVQFLDGGVYLQNDRGVRAAARLLGGVSDSVPLHGNHSGDILTAWFDGSGVARFWREGDLAAGNVTPMLTVNSGAPHHGAAVTLPGGQLVALSAKSATGTGPDGVVVFDLQGRRVDSTRACPNLHGLTTSAAGAAYGCSDGVLLVSAQNGRGVFTKITRADDPRFGSGTVVGRAGAANLLARLTVRGAEVTAATRMLGVVDVAGRTLLPITAPGGDIDWVFDLDYSGRHALMLGRTGNLYVFDMGTRQLTGRLDGFVPPMPTTGTVPTPVFASAEGLVYVSNPTRGEVVEVALTAAGVPTVARRLPVGGTPTRLVVLGVRRGGTVVAADQSP